MTRCTCDCSGGPLGTGRSAGFGGGTCAGAPAQDKTSQRSQRVPIAPNPAHNWLLSCHAQDSCNPAIGMHGELKAAAVQGAMHAPKSRCICISELQPSLVRIKRTTLHMAHGAARYTRHMQLAHQAASGALQQAAHWLRHAGYHCPMPALQGPEALLRRLDFPTPCIARLGVMSASCLPSV